jgi:hypothetical protein
MFVNGKASCAGAVVRTSALSEIKRAAERLKVAGSGRKRTFFVFYLPGFQPLAPRG